MRLLANNHPKDGGSPAYFLLPSLTQFAILAHLE